MTEIAKPNRKLLVGQLLSAEYKQTPWIVSPEAGTTLEEMMNPLYWAAVANQLRIGDVITVRNPSGQNIALLDVDVVQPFAAKMSIRWSRELRAPEKTQIQASDVPEGYEVKWRGPQHKWSVSRKDDKVMLFEGIDSRESAMARLKEHLALLTA